ncbi:unnamed protein product [Phytophthora lilii]|uniref:Unnamed protein product n=1 Tax=Phytophthora lilii TaxID=2077276 RepID=A0A9W6U5E8_9STRA|nr:unnamed protein product [Phytophthora lilii]
MELGSALPSINGKPAEHLGGQKCEMPDTRPTSSAATGGRRALGILPKSAGATSATRHARHSEVMTTSSWHSYGDQAQRRSSMHSPSRMVVRVFTSRTAANTRVEDDSNAKQQQHEDYTKELDGSYQDLIYDSRDEVQQLRDENATFRRENGLLRTKLVEKYDLHILIVLLNIVSDINLFYGNY